MQSMYYTLVFSPLYCIVLHCCVVFPNLYSVPTGQVLDPLYRLRNHVTIKRQRADYNLSHNLV